MNLEKMARWICETPGLFLDKAPIAGRAPFHLSSRPLPAYQGNRRLGFIYQYLCAELFYTIPGYFHIEEEIQLNHAGRTVGAIDFLASTAPGIADEHWEVAIKFYLLHQGHWFGPNAKDRLDLKLNRMLTHQLALSATDLFRESVTGWDRIKPRLLMQGRLYTNPFETEAVPSDCLGYELNPERIEGFWCYHHQSPGIHEPLYELTKPQWLTGKEADSPLYCPTPDRFVHCQSESGQFWFIMPASWPDTKKGG